MAENKAVSGRRIYSEICSLALPIALQNLLSAAVNSVDVVMLNFVGQPAVSAVSLAAQYAFIMWSLFFGLGAGCTILCAQYFGRKDFHAIEVIEGITLRCSLLVASAFFAGCFFFPNAMMRAFTNDAELVSLGAVYLRIVSVSFLMNAVVEVYFNVLKSVSRVGICTAINVGANLLNILLNAAFIFGWFSLPKLGIAGVALSTAISNSVRFAAALVVSARSRDIKLKLSLLFARSRALFSDFMKISVPALLNDVLWGLAFSLYSAIMGHLNSDAVAAFSFVGIVRNFGQVLCFGVANGGALLIGKFLGENDLPSARAAASKLVRLTVLSGFFGALVILGASPFVLKFARLTDQARYFLRWMLLINTYYVMGGAINTTFIVGIFRSGGDSHFGLVCDIIDMWCYALPLGIISAFALRLPVLWVYFLMCTDEFVKWPWVIRHYRSLKWLKNITRDDIS